MSEETKIEWADMTFNPWRGCSKVSPGCKFCYAERQAKRNPAVLGQWGRGRISVRGVESYLQLPHKWEKLAAQGRFVQCDVCGKREFRRDSFAGCSERSCLSVGSTDSIRVRPRVFCLSFGDWLDADVPIEWLVELLETIRLTPHLDWLLLTKRPENWRDRIEQALCFVEGLDYASANWMDADGPNTEAGCWINDWTGEMAPANVWVGTSVEDQIRADERIPALIEIPAACRFLSCEPLLGPVDLSGERLHHLDLPFAHPGRRVDPLLHWVIAGGESESKKNARPFALEWALDLKMQCKAAEVPFFLKQLGTNPYVENANLWDWPIDEDLVYTDLPPTLNCQAAASAGVHLRHKKGGDCDEWPEGLGVRQFPV